MKTLGNLIWILLIGFGSALVYLFIGLFLCITIIGIPFGKQCFKLASLSFTPFGTEVKSDFGKHPIINLIWMLIVGWELTIMYSIVGIIFCISIIGIPFGKQCFKLALLALFPFGAKI